MNFVISNIPPLCANYVNYVNFVNYVKIVNDSDKGIISGGRRVVVVLVQLPPRVPHLQELEKLLFFSFLSCLVFFLLQLVKVCHIYKI